MTEPAYTTADIAADVSAELRAILKPQAYQCWKYAWLSVVSATERMGLDASCYVEGWIVALNGESRGEFAEHGWATYADGLIELSPALDGAQWGYFPGVVYPYAAAQVLYHVPTVWHARRGDAAYKAAERAALAYARAHFPDRVRREVSRATRRIVKRQVAR